MGQGPRRGVWNCILEAIKKIESLRGTHILKDANYKVCVFFEPENDQDMYMETLYTYLHTQNFKKTQPKYSLYLRTNEE